MNIKIKIKFKIKKFKCFSESDRRPTKTFRRRTPIRTRSSPDSTSKPVNSGNGNSTGRRFWNRLILETRISRMSPTFWNLSKNWSTTNFIRTAANVNSVSLRGNLQLQFQSKITVTIFIEFFIIRQLQFQLKIMVTIFGRHDTSKNNW